jgi:predicted dithiol-disulfide oxidoreductase (DUF899 family)
MLQNRVVSRDEWLAARTELLRKEKELTRLRDQLSAERQALPWVKIEKTYEFDGPDGKLTLADLFDGRSQLVVKHFMFGPDWEQGCVGCSFGLDNIVGALVHLEHHDISYVLVSRAPLEKLEAFRRRMGWPVKWVSSNGSDFNFDFHVSFTEAELANGEAVYNFANTRIGIDEMPGTSVFYRDEAGGVFHTYSAYARGAEMFAGIFGYLDVMPKGRNETINGNLTDWVRHHDRYEDAPAACCHQEKP